MADNIREEKMMRIITAAAKVFAADGFHKATVERIANAAQIGKGTVYLYFNSKRDLFHAVIMEGFIKLNKQIAAIIASSCNSRDKLRQVISLEMSFFKDQEDLGRILISNKGSFDSKLHRMLFELQNKYILLISEIIKEGIEEGCFRNVDPLQAAMIFFGSSMVFNHCASCQTIFKEELNASPLFRAVDHAAGDTIMDIFLFGITK